MENTAIINLDKYTKLIKDLESAIIENKNVTEYYKTLLKDYESITDTIITRVVQDNSIIFECLKYEDKISYEYRRLVDIFINEGYKDLNNIDKIIENSYYYLLKVMTMKITNILEKTWWENMLTLKTLKEDFQF